MKNIFLIFLIFLTFSYAWSTPSKRLFDFEFGIGIEARLPESKNNNINISESMVHQTGLNSTKTVLNINDTFMGNFPELIENISAALKEIEAPTSTAPQKIDIQSNNLFEATTPEIKIFDHNQ